MSTARLAPSARRARLWAAAGTIGILAASLAACGGSSTDSATSPATTGGSTGSSDGSSQLAGEVSALTKPLDAYPVPSDPISNVKSLAGKTVFYIPITLQAPQFAATQKAITEAAGAAGLKVQVCDGKGTPTDINACVSRATDAKAGAIITDAIPYVLAANSLDAAQKAGIPVLINNQIPDPGHPASKTLDYIGQDAGSAMEAALAKWVTLDSGGKAHVLLNEDTDGPSPAAFVAAGQKVYASDCPGCKTTINKISSANFSLVPSSTSAALLKDPSITYVETQFEQFLQPTQTGIQQTSRSGIKTIAGAAALTSLKAIQSGSLAAAAGQATAYQAWIDVDAALRMMLGQQTPTYTIPVRLFTKDSMSDVKLTEAAQASGEWYGPATFPNDFKKLWSVG
jgi:ribose transport system substrate-binding protein